MLHWIWEIVGHCMIEYLMIVSQWERIKIFERDYETNKSDNIWVSWILARLATAPLTESRAQSFKMMDKIIPYNPSGLFFKDMFNISKDFNGGKLSKLEREFKIFTWLLAQNIKSLYYLLTFVMHFRCYDSSVLNHLSVLERVILILKPVRLQVC